MQNEILNSKIIGQFRVDQFRNGTFHCDCPEFDGHCTHSRQLIEDRVFANDLQLLSSDQSEELTNEFNRI